MHFFWIFPAHAKKMGADGPKWAPEDFFHTNPDLADILGRTDFDLSILIFLDFWAPSLGPAWAQQGAHASFLLRFACLHSSEGP